MKAFITKYALTEGIQEKEGEVIGTDGRYFSNSNLAGYAVGRFFLGPKDWTTDRDVAVERAESMRKAKIASLKKQIAKLEALKFE